MRRKCKIAYLNPRTVMTLLNFGPAAVKPSYIKVPKLTALPDGAVIQVVFADSPRGTIGVVVSHESFPEVPDGTIPEEIDSLLGMTTFEVLRVEEGTQIENDELRDRNTCLDLENSTLRRRIEALSS